MSQEPTYIPDAGEEREALAAWRLFAGLRPAQWMDAADIPWPAAWCLLRVTKPRKLPGEDDRIFAGDIDVLVGRLLSEPTISTMPKRDLQLHYFRHAANGFRFFVPEGSQAVLDLAYLVGMEVKCAYVDTDERPDGKRAVLRSQKDSDSKHRKLRRQLNSLLELGLDKVFLLDVVGGIPAEGNALHEAIAWAALSTSVVDAEHKRLAGGFAADLPIGHIEVTFGAQRGHAEDAGGFLRFGPKRPAPDNPRLTEGAVGARKMRLIQHVHGVLAQVQLAPQVPIVLDLCPRCGRLGPYHGAPCPA